jgi:hypothetical protein
MMNHFHLLVMEKDWKIAEVIKSLASSYVYYYNKKNERIGHLFQERFKSEPCNDMEYFTTLLRYIHQNPVKAGIVEDAADYEWSSWKQDYLRAPDELGWPISHVRAVLKRISLEDLRALVNEPCDANCVDVDNTRRLQDSEVRDFIIEQCGAKSVAEFQRLTMEEQKRIVLDAKAEGASIRQVMSHTGWSYRRVREAGGFEGEVEFDAFKPDGTMRKLIDVSKLHSLGWTHKVEIEDGVRKLFKWYQDSLQGD